MIVELNIGLDINGRNLNLVAITQQATTAIDYLRRELGPNALLQTRRFETEYEGPNGPVLERSLFVRFHHVGGLERIVYELAALLEQDCVAYFVPSQNRGGLIGPNAVKWGDFDAQYFKSFDVDFDVQRRAA